MTPTQAKQEALKRARGVLEAYRDGGGLDEHYSDSPLSEVKEIAAQFQKIIDGIDNRIKPEELFSLREVSM